MSNNTRQRGNPKPTVWEGIEYPSITAAAEAAGTDIGSMFRWRSRGWNKHSDVGGRGGPKPVTWEGVEYPSITAAAKALGVTHSSMASWHRRGWKCEAERKAPGNPRAMTWEGIDYPSQTAAARAVGVSPVTMSRWLSQGWNKSADIMPAGPVPVGRLPVIWEGKSYGSLAQASEDLGIDPDLLLSALTRTLVGG